jgi:hypothetical protein
MIGRDVQVKGLFAGRGVSQEEMRADPRVGLGLESFF